MIVVEALDALAANDVAEHAQRTVVVDRADSTVLWLAVATFAGLPGGAIFVDDTESFGVGVSLETFLPHTFWAAWCVAPAPQGHGPCDEHCKDEQLWFFHGDSNSVFALDVDST